MGLPRRHTLLNHIFSIKCDVEKRRDSFVKASHFVQKHSLLPKGTCKLRKPGVRADSRTLGSSWEVTAPAFCEQAPFPPVFSGVLSTWLPQKQRIPGW